MKEEFYINIRSEADGSHVIHNNDCPLLPGEGKRILLGKFRSAKEAIKEGKKFFGKTKCCPFCLKEYNTAGSKQLFPEMQDSSEPVSYRSLVPSWESALFCSVN